MSSSSSASSGGLGLAGTVFIVFLVLKLAEIGPVAHWSWWWVTSPLWITFGAAAAFIGLIFVVMFFAHLARNIAQARRSRTRMRAMMKED